MGCDVDSARWQHETGPWGTQPPHHQTGNADTEPGLPTTTNAHQPGAINPAHLTNTTTYQRRLSHGRRRAALCLAMKASSGMSWLTNVIIYAQLLRDALGVGRGPSPLTEPASDQPAGTQVDRMHAALESDDGTTSQTGGAPAPPSLAASTDASLADVESRLEELDPIIDEYLRLQAMATKLEEADRPTARRKRGGRRKVSGTRAAEVLLLAARYPGITIPELAEHMNIKSNYLYLGWRRRERWSGTVADGASSKTESRPRAMNAQSRGRPKLARNAQRDARDNQLLRGAG